MICRYLQFNCRYLQFNCRSTNRTICRYLQYSNNVPGFRIMAFLNYSRASVSATLERISSTGDDVSRILNQGGNIDTAIDLLRAAIANLTRISNSIDAEKLVGSCQSILPKSQKTACLCSHTIFWELQISPNIGSICRYLQLNWRYFQMNWRYFHLCVYIR